LKITWIVRILKLIDYVDNDFFMFNAIRTLSKINKFGCYMSLYKNLMELILVDLDWDCIDVSINKKR